MVFNRFYDILAHWAESTPAAPALKYERDGAVRTMSYAHLYAAVGEEAARTSASACEGFLISALEPETLIRFFGAVLAGRQTVLLDAATPVPVLRGQLPYTDADSLTGDSALVTELTGNLCQPKVPPHTGRILFFTSGTTARSRAVVLTEASLCASARQGCALLPLKQEDTLLCVLPVHHAFGFVCGLLWGLYCGACVALGRGALHRGEDFALFRPTAVSVVPPLLETLLKRRQLNAELRLLLVGGGDCARTLLDAARSLGMTVSFGYGLTETGSGVALSLEEDYYAMTVCPGCRVALAQDGEILIEARESMFQGYYKSASDTAAVLRGGVLRTGDLGALDAEGRLTVRGRKKEILVLSDGTKIVLPEYERELGWALGTRDLAVVLRHSVPALVLPQADGDVVAIWEMLDSVMETLPRSHRIREILFLGAPFPRTSTGKLRRWALEQQVRALPAASST